MKNIHWFYKFVFFAVSIGVLWLATGQMIINQEWLAGGPIGVEQIREDGRIAQMIIGGFFELGLIIGSGLCGAVVALIIFVAKKIIDGICAAWHNSFGAGRASAKKSNA